MATVNGSDYSTYGQSYTNNTMVVSLVDGIASFEAKYTAGVYSGAFPSLSSLNHIAMYQGSSNNGYSVFDVNYLGTNNQWNLVINAQRAGSGDTGYSATIARIKIEYIAI